MRVSLWSNANYGLFVSINQHKVNFQSARGKNATRLTKKRMQNPLICHEVEYFSYHTVQVQEKVTIEVLNKQSP